MGALDDWERLKRQERIQKRQEREAEKKSSNHWNFLAGDLVARYLKPILNISVYTGKDATNKNRDSFKPLENILVYLATHREFTTRIMSGSNELPPHDL